MIKKTVRICADCVHVERGMFHHYCTRKQTRNLVTGDLEGDVMLCEAEREDALRLEQFRCGVKGKYFEPKYILQLKSQ